MNDVLCFFFVIINKSTPVNNVYDCEFSIFSSAFFLLLLSFLFLTKQSCTFIIIKLRPVAAKRSKKVNEKNKHGYKKINHKLMFTPHWTLSNDVRLMVWPLHNHLAALQSVRDAVAVAVGVYAAVFDDPASVWNDYAVIVVTHCMDEDECWKKN